MTYQVTTIEEAADVLERFNYFHDGFIKRITMASQDVFEADKSQLCTGLFDVEIDFAHYNYGEGRPPYDQIITASFHNVRDILLDLRDVSFTDWSIDTFSIVAAERKNHFDQPEPCLAAKLMRHQLDEHRQWTLVEGQLFTFTEASFTEMIGLE